MKNILQIIKKEMDKIFKFPRMIFSTILLPGVLIFAIYAFMGLSMESEVDKVKEYTNQIEVINISEDFANFVADFQENNGNMNINLIQSMRALEDIKKDIKDGNIDLAVVFDENFDENLNEGKPGIHIYSNATLTNSSEAYNKIYTLLDLYKQEKLLDNGIDTNIFTIESTQNIYDANKQTGQILAMLLPMFIITFIFAGALSVGSDAIAGEKERGTLATLLMAPIKKTDIIIGKTISTAIIAILSALSSFIGILASLPLAKSIFAIEGAVTYSFYNYVQIVLILVITGILSSALILIASTFAKSTKEASSYAMPIYIIAILTSTISIFSTDMPNNISSFLIPLYNISLGLKGIFSFSLTNTQFLFNK